MLVELDYTKNRKTKYKCDRCDADLTPDTRYAIYVQEPKRTYKKKWDLCIRCTRALKRGIEKGKKGV